jgi:hypothetical protein
MKITSVNWKVAFRNVFCALELVIISINILDKKVMFIFARTYTHALSNVFCQGFVCGNIKKRREFGNQKSQVLITHILNWLMEVNNHVPCKVLWDKFHTKIFIPVKQKLIDVDQNVLSVMVCVLKTIIMKGCILLSSIGTRIVKYLL